MRRNKNLEQIVLVLIGIISGGWLLAQDILYLIPVLGLVGSVLAYENQKRIIEKERAGEILRSELKELIQPNGPQDHSRIHRIISDTLGEIAVDKES